MYVCMHGYICLYRCVYGYGYLAVHVGMFVVGMFQKDVNMSI